jgi:predicted RecA/RadA family phage recombinase
MAAVIRDGLGNARTLKYAHTSAVTKGEIIVVGGQVLVAISAALISALAIYVYRGRIQIPKTTGAIAAAAKVYWDPINSYGKTVKGLAAGTPAAGGGNTGNGTCTGEDVGDNAVDETWTLICVAAAGNAGTFSVVGSISGRMADAEVTVAYDNGFIEFTLNDGSADFVVGDTITIAVTQANTLAGTAIEAAESADTTLEIMLHEN